MGAGAIGPDRDFGGDPPAYPPPPYPPVEESFLDQDRALKVMSASFAGDASGTVSVELRNTGLVELAATSVDIVPAVPAAVTFARGSHLELPASSPEQDLTATFALVLDECLLPPDPSQEGSRLFEYTVTAEGPGEDPVSHEATYQVVVDVRSACEQGR